MNLNFSGDMLIGSFKAEEKNIRGASIHLPIRLPI